VSASPDPAAHTALERPPDSDPSAALPLNARDGTVSVAVTGEHQIAELLSEPVARVVARLALPAVASNLLMTLFFSVDTFWVGTRIGADALAAVSTSAFWVWMVVASAEMVSIGLTAVAARRHGEGRHGEAARVAGEALLFGLALGLVVAAAGLSWLGALFDVMGTPPEVTRLGRAYLGAYLLGAPLLFGFFVVDAAFRASGDTRTPFLLLASTVVVALVLDPILILGLWGAPELGIAGAAVATICTRGAAFVIGVILLARRGLVRLTTPRPASIAAVARIGLPTALTGVLFSLIYIGMTRTTTRFGTPALAALGLGHRVESWLYMMGVGFGAAAAAVVGQNLGAGRADRAERAGWTTVRFALIPGIITFGLALAVPERLAALFTSDAAVIAETALYLRIVAISQLALCAEIVLEGALGGAGDTVPPMLTSTFLTVLRIPLAAWAASRWGTAGIWWTISLTATARGIAMAILWRRGGWKRKSV
jgi:putative MATE family efflux protein